MAKFCILRGKTDKREYTEATSERPHTLTLVCSAAEGNCWAIKQTNDHEKIHAISYHGLWSCSYCLRNNCGKERTERCSSRDSGSAFRRVRHSAWRAAPPLQPTEGSSSCSSFPKSWRAFWEEAKECNLDCTFAGYQHPKERGLAKKKRRSEILKWE